MAEMEVEGLYKIFGNNPDKALRLLEEGKTKSEIKNKTGSVVGLNNINVQVEKGSIHVIMGLSGSGKSTFLRCVNRLVEPTKGKVRIDGKEVLSMNETQLRELRRKKFGMVFQRFSLLPHKTLLENVVFGLEIRGEHKTKRTSAGREALKKVGLEGWEESYPSELSGGMQQRVGLARALATDPQILLMDEPFSALDPLIRNQMQEELLKLQKQLKKTILFITHDLDEALRLGDKISILNEEGKIVQNGSPEEIVLNPKSGFVETFVKNVDEQSVIRAETVMQEPSYFSSGSEPNNTEGVKGISAIREALPLLLKYEHPIPVLGPEGKVIGEINRKKMVQILGEEKINQRAEKNE